MNEKIIQTAFAAFTAGVYKKNINFIFKDYIDIEEFQNTKMLGGSPAMSAYMIQQCHRKIGVQMQVTKQVSDDLIATDFAAASSVENVPWPNRVIELYFEDPLLPTILVMKISPEELQRLFPEIEIALKSEEYITALMQEGGGWETSQLLSVQLRPDMYEEFLSTGETEKMETGIFSHNLSEKDNCSMSFMLNLALKVLAFASIPTYKPINITRKQMTFGGKPDVKGRPNRPSFRLDYLPKIIYAAKPIEKIGDHRDFRGRRGFIRWYEHERFVAKKGTWDFIQPVKDPHTGKYPERKVIKVRKP